MKGIRGLALGIIALATLAACLSAPPDVRAWQVHDWKGAACTWYVAHCFDPELPLLRGVNPHASSWGRPMQRLARWEQSHTANEPTGRLDIALRNLLRPYLRR